MQAAWADIDVVDDDTIVGTASSAQLPQRQQQQAVAAAGSSSRRSMRRRKCASGSCTSDVDAKAEGVTSEASSGEGMLNKLPKRPSSVEVARFGVAWRCVIQ